MDNLNFPLMAKKSKGLSGNAIEMKTHIKYRSDRMFEISKDFDGFIKFDPYLCERNAKIKIQDQNAAIRELYEHGDIDGRRGENGEIYLKIKQEKQEKKAPPEWHRPRDEAGRRWMKLARNPPTYQHGKTVCDYLEEADRNFKDPDERAMEMVHDKKKTQAMANEVKRLRDYERRLSRSDI